MTPGELRVRIEERMAARDVRVTTGPLHEDGTILMRVNYGGKPCVELTCRVAGMAPPPVQQEEAAQGAQPPAASDTGQAVPPQEELPLESERVEGAAGSREASEAPPAPPGPRSDAASARIALILDDGGYGGEVTAQMLELDSGLTLAILPHTPFAAQTARAAAEKGFEVMVHMPMETHSKKVRAFPRQLTVEMTPEQIAQTTADALAQVPGAKGINNHTGSRFTADAEKLRAFFAAVKPAQMYFVDSRTSPDTRAYEVAREMGVPAGRRDVFLDNDSDPDAIRRQFGELVRKAREKGSAVGIGHVRASTVAVLAEELPELAGQGVQLVHASELMEAPRQLAMEKQ